MKLAHFERLAPICPLCKRDEQRFSSISIGSVAAGDGERVRDGTLVCSHAGCQLEFPIIDGIPIIAANVRTLVAEQLPALTRRTDFTAATASILGDAAGQGSEFDAHRQRLSIYGWDGYAEYAKPGRETAPRAAEPQPGSIARCLRTGIALLPRVAGPILDLGCAVGRSTFELATLTDEPVIGIDLSFPMLRLATQVLETGVARFPKRRVGLVYDDCEVETPFGGRRNVDFWLCDALALPFREATFACVVALNLLDCVPSPLGLLGSIESCLAPAGQSLIGSPYDWSAAATPVEAWIGGHSQRGPGRGGAEALMTSLLTPGAHPQSSANLSIIGERPDVPWHTRLHARSTVQYSTHLLALEKHASA